MEDQDTGVIETMASEEDGKDKDRKRSNSSRSLDQVDKKQRVGETKRRLSTRIVNPTSWTPSQLETKCDCSWLRVRLRAWVNTQKIESPEEFIGSVSAIIHKEFKFKEDKSNFAEVWIGLGDAELEALLDSFLQMWKKTKKITLNETPKPTNNTKVQCYITICTRDKNNANFFFCTDAMRNAPPASITRL